MTIKEAPSRLSQLFSTIYEALFDPTNVKGFNQFFERFIATLIIASLVAVIFENTPVIRSGNEFWFHWFDVITIAIFSIEFFLRVATASSNPEFSKNRHPALSYIFSFYGLVDLVAIVPFYFAHFVEVDVEVLRVLRVLRLARMFKLSRELLPALHEFQSLNVGRSFRGKVYALLEPTGHSGRLHAYIDDFIVFWVALSIFCVIFETVDSFYELFAFEFHVIDVVAFSIFTIEYVARVYAAPENPKFKHLQLPRLGQIRSGQAIIDLLAILPFILERLISTQIDLRFLRVFRLMRMLKLTRYTSAISTLSRVLVREWQVIFAAVFVLMLLIVLTASLGFLFEHEAQPDIFQNIPQSIYWSVTTLSSIGYGDMVPITPMGRIATVIVALIGVGVFAIPAGLLASAFTDQLHIDRENFKKQLVQAYEDGTLTHAERELITAEAERLHLSKEEIARLTIEAKREFEAQEESKQSEVNGLILDVVAHPELAAAQFRLLTRQLNLLIQATGPEALDAELKKIHPQSDCVNQKILEVMSKN